MTCFFNVKEKSCRNRQIFRSRVSDDLISVSAFLDNAFFTISKSEARLGIGAYGLHYIMK